MQVPPLAQQLCCRPALDLDPEVGRGRAAACCQLWLPGCGPWMQSCSPCQWTDAVAIAPTRACSEHARQRCSCPRCSGDPLAPPNSMACSLLAAKLFLRRRNSCASPREHLSCTGPTSSRAPKPRLCELQQDVSVPGQRVGPRVASARHRAVRRQGVSKQQPGQRASLARRARACSWRRSSQTGAAAGPQSPPPWHSLSVARCVSHTRSEGLPGAQKPHLLGVVPSERVSFGA